MKDVCFGFSLLAPRPGEPPGGKDGKQGGRVAWGLINALLMVLKVVLFAVVAQIFFSLFAHCLICLLFLASVWVGLREIPKIQSTKVDYLLDFQK